MSKTSGSDIQESRGDTAGIEISCSVKGYQECRFRILLDVVRLVRKSNSQQNRCSILFDAETLCVRSQTKNSKAKKSLDVYGQNEKRQVHEKEKNK